MQASSDPIVKGQGLKAKKARYRMRKFQSNPFAPTAKKQGDAIVTMTEAERQRWRQVWKARHDRAVAYLVTLALLKD